MTVGNQKPAILSTPHDVRVYVRAARQDGRRIAFVPTMGALHEGHLTLVREGLGKADVCIASIFVNPTQFGPNEDFSAYPRTWEADLEKLTAAGAQAVFHPAVEEMYPAGAATAVSVAGVTEPLEGACRPGHFNGVATVVAKLLLQVMPDIALFGEKDWQQLQVIKRMAADLNIPVVIEGVPTVRDDHGLALSSRNAYLSPEQLAIARRLNKILFSMAARIGRGEDIAAVEEAGAREIKDAGFDSVDYLAVRAADTLQPVTRRDGDLRILTAVRLGRARLIDNVAA